MQERRPPIGERADGEGLRRVAPDEQVVAAVEHQPGDLRDLGVRRDGEAIGFAPARLAQGKKAERQQHARQAGVDERAAPVAESRELPADGVADGRADRDGHVEKGQRGVAARRR